MNAHVSWRVVLQRIDESEMAEDDNILTAAGKNNSWSLLENKELGLYTSLLGKPRRLLLGSTNLVDSCRGYKTGNLQFGGKHFWRLHWGTQNFPS